MNDNFEKSDLRSGYLVVLSDGSKRLVQRAGNFTKILINPRDGEWNYLDGNWDSDLKYRPVYSLKSCESTIVGCPDIDAVYGLVEGVRNYRNALSTSTEGRKLLWMRSKCIRISVSELREVVDILQNQLGIKFEIV